MQSSIPKNQKQKEFYNALDPTYLKYEKNIPYAKHLVTRLLSHILQFEKAQILEIGAGQGRFTLELAQRVKRLTATDLSEKQIEILQNKIKTQRSKIKIKTQRLNLQQSAINCSVYDLLKPIPKVLKNRKFDAITGFFMLHHIDRKLYHQVIKNMLPLLKKGGRLVFIEPNCLYPFHLVEMLIEPDMHFEIEKQIYSNYLGTFKKSAEQLGLKLINFERFGFFPPPIINVFPSITTSEKWIEKIPIFQQLLTPFVIITYTNY
jgi:2-polyprenyl-3-methyl-5-hydroxy-6-metoxy-1,4-benzoquinol methylase